ncbi:hypothetical protein PALA111701_22250 [Paenibacillus lactis]
MMSGGYKPLDILFLGDVAIHADSFSTEGFNLPYDGVHFILVSDVINDYVHLFLSEP